MSVYYNDNDPYCAQWLRNLIAAGHLPAGEVDERPIQSVTADDVRRFRQCHFFAGIGGWPLALGLAGWSESVWTGSCPCQPFSDAGARKGSEDARHIWPEFYRLIGECKPAIVFGEQVASEAGREWLAGIFSDLEVLGYACAAADMCAASIGAPHVRQRLFWISDATRSKAWAAELENGGRKIAPRQTHPASSYRGFACRDGGTYRVPESEIDFVVDGFSGCVEQISAYGNAIVPQVAAHFIGAVMECMPTQGATP